MILLRTLVRLVAFVLLVVLAVVGLAVAVCCVHTGTQSLSLSWLARQVHLPQLRDQVGSLLATVEAHGPTALLTALAGVAAILLGLLLLVGVLGRRRERVVTLADGADGRLDARRRPLAQVAAALVEQVRGVTTARAKVRSRRRRGARVRLVAARTSTADPADVQRDAGDALADLNGAFALRTRVRTELGDRGSRVA